MNKKILTIISILAISTLMAGWQYAGKQDNPGARQPKRSAPLTFLSVKRNKIINEKGSEVNLRGIHYDAFYVISKRVYFASGQNGEDIDRYNTELSKYWFTDGDIKIIKDIGANAVRIGFRLWQIEKEPYEYSEESLRHLDDTIAKFGENGIYVILDLHAAGQNALPHNNEYGNILWDDEGLQNRVAALWGVIAGRYKDKPYVAGYDIINEPKAPAKKALHGFYQKVIDKIREKDKKHILFIEWNLSKPKDILFGGEYTVPWPSLLRNTQYFQYSEVSHTKYINEWHKKEHGMRAAVHNGDTC